MHDPTSEKLSSPAALPPAVTRRALATGFILVALVAALAPYNDSVIHNTPLIGNYLPVGLVSLLLFFVLIVNPLLKRLGKKTYASGELAVAFSLGLIASSVPTSGLIRYAEPMLVSPFDLAQRYPWLKPYADMIPNLLVPSKDPNSPIISNWFLGIDAVRGDSVPVLPFLIPAALWTILLAALFGSAISLANIFRKQWIVNERLSYPLATIPLELFAEPEPPRYYNALTGNTIFWTGAAIPLFLYTLSGLHSFIPAVPEVSLQYNFSDAFSDHPWDLLPRDIVSNRLYFAVVGITLFIPSDVAFSLVFFTLAHGLSQMFLIQTGLDPSPTEPFRAMGAYFAYFISILWLARRHLAHVALAAWRNTPRDPEEFTSYRTMILSLLLCNTIAILWLMGLGMSLFTAILLLLLGTIQLLLFSRILAETGLFFLGATWVPTAFLSSLLGHAFISTTSFNAANLVSRFFYNDLRENIMPFATTTLRLGSTVHTSQKRKFLLSLLTAVALSFLISACVNHYYSYTLGRQTYGKDWESSHVPYTSLQESHLYATQPPPISRPAAWSQLTLGALMLAGTVIGHATFVAWPLHPVGLILMNAWPLRCFWFSIAVGWTVKHLLLRYGGSSLFKRIRPFFIGLIAGELIAVGLWLLIGLLTAGAITFKVYPT